MIMADEGIPFEVVVGVMDIARDMKTESGETTAQTASSPGLVFWMSTLFASADPAGPWRRATFHAADARHVGRVAWWG